VVEPLFGEVAEALSRAGGCPSSPVATYEADEDGGVRIVLGYDYAGAAAPGFEVRTLPAVGQGHGSLLAEGICGHHAAGPG
jgi:hypothetical protein